MARKKRRDHPGAWHHVMNRGARKELIFWFEQHCWLFLEILAETANKFCLEVHAYSLMPNHFHLLIRALLGNLSKSMAYLLSTYTIRLNRIYRWDGPLFRGRFKNQTVYSEAYRKYLLAYIHLNPVTAHLVRKAIEPCWTSHRAYLGLDPSPDWLTMDYFLDQFGSSDAIGSFIESVHRGRIRFPDEMDQETGWFSEKPQGPSATLLSTEELENLRGSRNQTCRSTLQRICTLTRCSESDLKMRVNGAGANPQRRFAVWALKRATQLSHKQVGEILGMSSHQVANILCRIRRGEKSSAINHWINKWLSSE